MWSWLAPKPPQKKTCSVSCVPCSWPPASHHAGPPAYYRLSSSACIAEFKAPGLYVLYPVLLKELEEGLPGGGGGDLLAPAEQQASPPVPSVDGAPATKKRRAASAAPAGAAPATAGDRGGVQRRPPAAGKRARLDWTDDDSSDAEQQPAAQRTRQQPAAVHTASAPAAVAAAASPPSVGGGPAGASSGSGGAVAGGAGVPLRRTSSSRGSDQADESWIEEHADRQPQPAAPIHSKEVRRCASCLPRLCCAVGAPHAQSAGQTC